MSDPTPISLVTLGAVMVCWFAFAGIFLFRKKPPKQAETRRDRLSFIGIFLQICAYALVWFQPPHTPFLPPVAALSGVPGILLSVFTVALAVASIWLTASAVKMLGKQWAVAARLVEGHKLITDGPYRFVRNPIYTAMFGMLIATGLAMERWLALSIAIVLFAVGLLVRVKIEEKLLRAAFGQEFDDYARRVPAVVPGIY
jgi:protein-S-isoprenylcysteine O-methyltransferase Ste14